ncbi:CarD family transcriptional regulator [Ornithinimicrobium faecis]|uniref:CarD family transcriptional regulator n=1 Tax=Ornithinimicrobium faecis TaxID=2934158 RepID=UPI002117B795|nr:CarD family transcriptional regulator [Ornithinimicrobium sp. HY1745]
MQFNTGQLLIHPHHGPARVEGTMTRVVGGTEREYVTLRVQRSDLTVSLPADTAEEAGIRLILSGEQLQEVLDELRAPSVPFDRQFSRRMKNQQDRLLQGDLRVTAGVVRDLIRRDRADGVSPAEKDLLKRAKEPLLGELVEALSVTEERAEELVLAAVTGEDIPTPAELAIAG